MIAGFCHPKVTHGFTRDLEVVALGKGGSVDQAKFPIESVRELPCRMRDKVTFVSKAPSLGYAGPLDGLRGWAIILVLLAHGSYLQFGSLVGGVDIFFVVSGFLICTLLLEENRQEGRISLRHFYARRALRLLPLMYLTLAATLAGALILGNQELWHKTVSDVTAGGLYIYHIVHPVGVELTSGGPPPIRPLIQLWSLSVEEHFYVFGALLTIATIRFRVARLFVAACVCAVAVITSSRLLGHVGPRLAWYQRPDSLLVGVIAAYLNASFPRYLSESSQRLLRRGSSIAVLVLIAVFGVGTGFGKLAGVFVPFGPDKGDRLQDGLYWGRFGFTVVAFATAWLTVSVVRCPDQRVVSFLGWKPLMAIGRRSYAIYLIHVPLAVLMDTASAGRKRGLAAILYLLLLVLSVEVAHRCVERPISRFRRTLGQVAAPDIKCADSLEEQTIA